MRSVGPESWSWRFSPSSTQSGPSADSVTETRGNPGLILGYQAEMLDEADECFAGRTVTLRAEPHLHEGEMDRFIIDSVLKTAIS